MHTSHFIASPRAHNNVSSTWSFHHDGSIWTFSARNIPFEHRCLSGSAPDVVDHKCPSKHTFYLSTFCSISATCSLVLGETIQFSISPMVSFVFAASPHQTKFCVEACYAGFFKQVASCTHSFEHIFNDQAHIDFHSRFPALIRTITSTNSHENVCLSLFICSGAS